MAWAVAIGWIFAVLVAVVVLGFCGYELGWKSARLQRDLSRLQALRADLAQVQEQLADAQRRVPQRGGS